MKIEPFPWLQDYLIDMDELYTELTLKKLNNTRFGVTGKTLGNYVDMFEEDSQSGNEAKKPKKTEKKKENSLKGRPGNGQVDVRKENRARLGQRVI